MLPKKLVEGSSPSLELFSGAESCRARVTRSDALECAESADSSPDVSSLGPSRREVVLLCLLALDGDAVSACILFNVFPIEEIFPLHRHHWRS